MAGHSKWANIQHRKKSQDNKRGKVFTKIIREVSVATKLGGSDVSSNSRLRLAISKANSANVPKDTLERAIKKASGQDNQNFDEIVYEGYGPNGIAIIVNCLTDNKNRTVSEVRNVLTKNGGSLGTKGSVSHLFKKIGVIKIFSLSEEDLFTHLDQISLVDYEHDADNCLVFTDPGELFSIKNYFEDNKFKTTDEEIIMEPSVTVDISEEQQGKALDLLQKLEDLDDVQSVYMNINLSPS
tara:strand:- start:30082 stop:30801 length:720 start_codon:yes stop_codon:yes gene_type:complete